MVFTEFYKINPDFDWAAVGEGILYWMKDTGFLNCRNFLQKPLCPLTG